jgi:putative N6-adenine-specific DNA methylase
MADRERREGDAAERLSDRALERRAKRWLRTGPFACFIQTAPGLEEVLAGELRAGGYDPEGVWERGGVSLRLDHDEIMRANLSLRTASRVLLRLATFPAATPDMLFDRAGKVPWEIHIGSAPAYRLRVSARGSRLQAGDGVTNLLARSIDRRMRTFGLRPSLREEAELEFRVRILADRCTVSLNTSGEHLHRRGVRRHIHDAPVRETVAAALALVAYRGHDTIVDPFCGSGTLLLEAADLIGGLPPGRHRSFAFESAGWHRPGRWREVQRAARWRAEISPPGSRPRLIGLDASADALAAARHNLAAAEHAQVELVRGDSTLLDLDGFGARRGLLLANLPYGVRLGDRDDAGALIGRFLDRLALATSTWDVAFLTTHPRLLAQHGALHVQRTLDTESGGLRVTMVVGSSRSA